MFKKYQHHIVLMLLGSAALISCKKWDDYKKYQQSTEKVYPGIFSNANAYPGQNRALLTWTAGLDPAIAQYFIYWNNGHDSMIVNATKFKPGDTVDIMVNNLAEMSHNFTVYSSDVNGNRSVPVGINNVKVYGDVYKNGLQSRPFKSYEYTAGKVLVLVSAVPDTVYVGTEVRYTDTSGNNKTAWISAGMDSLTIKDWYPFTAIAYNSSYLPNSKAIDTVVMAKYDTVKLIHKYYRATGTRYNYNADGSPAGTTVIDLDKQVDLNAAPASFYTDDIANLGDRANSRMILSFNNDNTIDISGYLDNTDTRIVNHPAAAKSYYDPATGQIVLRYKYTNSNGTYRLMEEIWSKN